MCRPAGSRSPRGAPRALLQPAPRLERLDTVLRAVSGAGQAPAVCGSRADPGLRRSDHRRRELQLPADATCRDSDAADTGAADTGAADTDAADAADSAADAADPADSPDAADADSQAGAAADGQADEDGCCRRDADVCETGKASRCLHGVVVT